MMPSPLEGRLCILFCLRICHSCLLVASVSWSFIPRLILNSVVCASKPPLFGSFDSSFAHRLPPSLLTSSVHPGSLFLRSFFPHRTPFTFELTRSADSYNRLARKGGGGVL
ncbi:hypothetical protein EDB80DRAFT_291140 [Ilyonectria destructans]|nr:hypothetical protein EDB80DRAFT_291140 [Ilyonectria destructans]